MWKNFQIFLNLPASRARVCARGLINLINTSSHFFILPLICKLHLIMDPWLFTPTNFLKCASTDVQLKQSSICVTASRVRQWSAFPDAAAKGNHLTTLADPTKLIYKSTWCNPIIKSLRLQWKFKQNHSVLFTPASRWEYPGCDGAGIKQEGQVQRS